MAGLNELEVLEGHIEVDRFILKGIAGHDIEGIYKAEGLLSLAMLIHYDEPFSFSIDKERTIFVPVELNKTIIKELLMLAEELNKG